LALLICGKINVRCKYGIFLLSLQDTVFMAVQTPRKNVRFGSNILRKYARMLDCPAMWPHGNMRLMKWPASMNSEPSSHFIVFQTFMESAAARNSRSLAGILATFLFTNFLYRYLLWSCFCCYGSLENIKGLRILKGDSKVGIQGRFKSAYSQGRFKGYSQGRFPQK
jgi:predicted metal-dependent hydrolase